MDAYNNNIDLHRTLIGNWQGNYRLVLSWLPEPNFISVSNMTVSSVANGKFLILSYNWKHEGVAQDGLLLIGNLHKQDELTGSWVDSWGMSGGIMQCHGTIGPEGDIFLRGNYEVKGSTEWGWRISIPFPRENVLQILMYNISPEQEEFLAGDANYTRL